MFTSGYPAAVSKHCFQFQTAVLVSTFADWYFWKYWFLSNRCSPPPASSTKCKISYFLMPGSTAVGRPAARAIHSAVVACLFPRKPGSLCAQQISFLLLILVRTSQLTLAVFTRSTLLPYFSVFITPPSFSSRLHWFPVACFCHLIIASLLPKGLWCGLSEWPLLHPLLILRGILARVIWVFCEHLTVIE